MKKLLALSERGVGGEADNARRILKSLLEKYNVTLEDLRSEKRLLRSFPYKFKEEMTLFYQILINTYGSKSKQSKEAYYNSKHKRLYVPLTDLEYIDVSNMWEFYRNQFAKERSSLLNDMLTAFIMKHNIFDLTPDPSREKPEEPDWEHLEKILNMSSEMENVYYHKAIEK